MRFINYKQLQELQEAARNGNENAKNIIGKYMEDQPDMDSIERLIGEYYGNAGMKELELKDEIEKGGNVENAYAQEIAEPHEEIEEEEIIEEIQPEEPIDISEDLDRELDGLIDDDEFDDIKFTDFIGNRKKDKLRAKKNAEYFKAFDPKGRENYLNGKLSEYDNGFGERRRKIERGVSDIDSAISKYGEYVTDLPEDEIEVNIDSVSQAYDDFTKDEATMDAFGRHWDEHDLEQIKGVLQSLANQYGKKNVQAILNTLREDCKAWGEFCNGRIKNSVDTYGKALSNLLK